MNFVARYRILESLGRGGMGEVFLADDTQLERKVAIKFLPDELQDDPVARGRFEREAKSAAALDHPFICKIYEVAQVDGRAWCPRNLLDDGSPDHQKSSACPKNL